MPVPSVITDLSTTAGSNYPAGSDSPATLDDTQRALGSFIRQLYDGTYPLPITTVALTTGSLFAATAGFTLNTGYAAGTIYLVLNDSAAAITVTQGAGLTLRLEGTASTGNRTVSPRSFCMIFARSTTEYYVSGSGVL